MGEKIFCGEIEIKLADGIEAKTHHLSSNQDKIVYKIKKKLLARMTLLKIKQCRCLHRQILKMLVVISIFFCLNSGPLFFEFFFCKINI